MGPSVVSLWSVSVRNQLHVVLQPYGIFWLKFAYTLIWTRSSQKDCQNDIYHWSRLCRVPNFEKLKLVLTFLTVWNISIEALPRSRFWICQLALSLEPCKIVWWTIGYTLILTRSSPRDFQMSFFVGQGFAEVQFRKKSKQLTSSPEPYGIFW